MKSFGSYRLSWGLLPNSRTGLWFGGPSTANYQYPPPTEEMRGGDSNLRFVSHVRDNLCQYPWDRDQHYVVEIFIGLWQAITVVENCYI